MTSEASVRAPENVTGIFVGLPIVFYYIDRSV